MQQSLERSSRRPKGLMNSLATNFFHFRNPYTTAWWSTSYPGFGHISMGNYVSGFLLFFWEMVVNTKAKVNLAILYSFTGRYDMAKEIVDNRWLLLYVLVFIFAIWDSYRLALQFNQLAILADRHEETIQPVHISIMEINTLDRRSPWVAVVWSVVAPGLGHIYTHRIPTGFFLIIWWIAIAYYSFLFQSTQYSALGLFEQAKAIVDPEWLMYLPSIYGFAIYDAYVNTVEYNRLFEKEQAAFFKKNYQNPDFKMPTGVETDMHITATFEHSLKLELAISELEHKGIAPDHICAIPMNTPRKNMEIFDSIHRADGMSMFDLPTVLGTVFMLFGVMWGFMWTWGPIIWGLIALFAGGALGFACKYMYYKLYVQRQPAACNNEVLLIVGCQKSEGEMVEKVLSGHLALSLGRKE
ncbi:hypothetical protein [Sporomusa termitida]|uniref:Uncharacterized protein n=1 Tax=Sporomusa termitida TaxID=2377 RepID=A0A517DZY1_9FIRM|nr:hypothetical protein [Sporomusa termitida]QDR82912.1 hypothetical protein SPTER_43600 [Sporomusa termitida]